jgi:putative endonuclease
MTESPYWLVYILCCADGTYYTGITNNLEHRLAAHNAGTGAKYTKGRRPVVVIDQRTNLTRSEAQRLEYRVKREKGHEQKRRVLHERIYW